MEQIDVAKEELAEVEVLGRLALFTALYLDRETV